MPNLAVSIEDTWLNLQKDATAGSKPGHISCRLGWLVHLKQKKELFFPDKITADKNHEYTGVAPRTGFFPWMIDFAARLQGTRVHASVMVRSFSNIRYRGHPGTGTT